MRINWFPYKNILKITNTYRMFDDFQGDVSVRRNTGAIIPDRSQTATDLVRLHRPLWTFPSGAPYSLGGALTFPVGHIVPEQAETQEAIGGTRYLFDLWIGLPRTMNSLGIHFLYANAGNSLYIKYDALNDSLEFWEDVGGAPNLLAALIGGDPTVDYVDIVIERVAPLNWQVTVDGTVNGPFVVVAEPDQRYIFIDNTMDAMALIRYFGIV